jgi:putative NADH-flavin reductase
MKITIFGSTGELGSECLKQALAAGHEITALVRDDNKLPQDMHDKIAIIEGDALAPEDIKRALTSDTEAILFAIGVDKQSPDNLCTDITELIVQTMREENIPRFVWCGGGSVLIDEDQVALGAKFVHWYAKNFMAKVHADKEHQYAFLQEHRDIHWIGVRPLQMKSGQHTGNYRLGFDRFSGMSNITFADCADAMIAMLTDDTWLGQAPIIQY